MKKEYIKPSIHSQEFVPNVAVAACSTTIVGQETTFPKQTVNCIVSGSDTIFATSSICGAQVVEKAKIVTVDGITYFVWYDGVVAGQPTNAQRAQLDKIYAAAGVSGPGYHAGQVTSSISDILGFSY